MPWEAVGAIVAAAIGAAAASASADKSIKANKELMEEQNTMNMKNYKQRYQLTTEDMRKAGLNPILAATGGFSVGNAPQVQTHAPDMSAFANSASAMANSAKAFGEASMIDEETEKVKAETEKLKNDADLSLTEALYKRGLTDLAKEQEKKVGFDIQETMSRTAKTVAETDYIGAQKSFTEQKTSESRANERKLVTDIQVNIGKVQEIQQNILLLKEKGELTRAETAQVAATTNNLRAQLNKLEAISDVYKDSVGKYIAYIKEVQEAARIPGSGIVGGMFKSYDEFMKDLETKGSGVERNF